MQPRLVAPMHRLITMPRGIPEFTLGWAATRWATEYLRHPDGDRAGLPWHFTESQLMWYLWWYALDKDMRWIHDHGVRRLAKGAGKSPNAGAHCWIEFCAPVRPAYLDPSVPGGVVGKRVGMPLIEIAATAESQTANTMRMVRALAGKKSKLVKTYGIDVGKTVMYGDNNAELRVITSSASAEEGSLTTFAVLDETEHWHRVNGGHDLAAVMDRNLGKSGSRGVETCNAWEPGKESVAELTYDAWCLQEEGRTISEERILYDARISPPTLDMTNEESVEKCLAFVYGDCYWVDLRNTKSKALSVRTPEETARRFYFNQPRSSSRAWIQPQEFQVISKPELTLELVNKGDEIVMFFDGSRTQDASALIACHAESGHIFTLGIWEPEKIPGTDDTIPVPVHEIDAAVEQAFRNFKVVGFWSDVREWESFTRVEWPKRYAEQFEDRMWAVPNGKEPLPIAWDMRTHVYDFTMGAELTEREIIEGSFTHDGDSVLVRHVQNAVRYPNRWGVSVSKETPNSGRKIDACVAMIGARIMRRIYVLGDQRQGKKQKERSGNVYGF